MSTNKRRLSTPSELGNKRLQTMWADRSFADLEVNCAGQTWIVHQAVLAAGSPVFKRMLMSDFEEGQKKRIDIKEADKACVELMLKFCYTGNVSLDDLCISSCSSNYHREYRISGLADESGGRNGKFELVEGEIAHGFPIWKKSGESMWICSTGGEAAQWQVTNAKGNLSLCGEPLSGKPHCGRLPCRIGKANLLCTLACSACSNSSQTSAPAQQTPNATLKGLLGLATLFDIKDLVHVCVAILIDEGMMDKDNVVMVARALRDAGLGDESQELLAEVHSTLLKDKGIFMAMVQQL